MVVGLERYEMARAGNCNVGTSSSTSLYPVALDTLVPAVSAIPSTQAASSMEGDEKQQDDWASSRKNRLPSFTEVLSRRTRPPVDLFMF